MCGESQSRHCTALRDKHMHRNREKGTEPRRKSNLRISIQHIPITVESQVLLLTETAI